MRNLVYWCIFFACVTILIGCASSPKKTTLQLSPEPGTSSLSQQELDYAYNTAVSTGLDMGYRVVSSSVEQRAVTLNRFRSADSVFETMEVSIESKGDTATVNITYKGPKPVEEETVKEFTDRFMTKLKAKPAVQAGGVAAPESPQARGKTEKKPSGVETGKGTHLILLKNGNIRMEPSTNAKIITTLKKGQVINKLNGSGDWYEIELPRGGGKGWIAKSLVKEVE